MTDRQAGSGTIARRIGARSTSVAASLLSAAWLPAHAAATDPIKLAIFDFELEDVSAGASPAGENSFDAAQLASVTGEVRQLLAQSGRYRLVDVGSADAPATKAHALRECDGCDAAIARQLGA
jgi:hypothetical protein